MTDYRKPHRLLMRTFCAALALATSAGLANAGDIRFTYGEYSGQTKPFWDKVVAEFEAANPDINVTAESIPWSNYLQTLTTDISANNAPDVSVLASIWLSDFSDQGLIEPIRNLISPELEHAFVPALLGPSNINGELMGVPFAASARAMMINTDLYAKAGVAAPTSWDDLRMASEKIAATGAFGFGLPGKEEEVDVYFYYALWGFGGQILADDGSSGLDSAQGIEAATFYSNLVKDGLTQPEPTAYSREDVFNLFKQGKIGTIFTFPMLVPQIKAEAPDLKFQVLPFPTKISQYTMGITDSLAVFKSSDAKEDVRKFIDFIFQENYQAEFDRVDGLLPVLSSVVALDYYQKDPDIKAFADGLAYAHFQPTVKRWDSVIDATTRALQSLYLGDATPEAAMTAAANEVEAILAGN